MKYESYEELFLDAAQSVKVQDCRIPVCLQNGVLMDIDHVTFDITLDYKFPLAIIEGKCVYAGDKMHYSEGFLTVGCTVNSYDKSYGLQIVVGGTLYLKGLGLDLLEKHLSWPKPKTKKIKMQCWLTCDGQLVWKDELCAINTKEYRRVPSEDKIIEVTV